MQSDTIRSQAADLATQYQAEVKALHAYLTRVGFSVEIADQAVAEAVINVAQRPDIERPMAFMSTVARGEAHRLKAIAEAKGDRPLTAPDLMKAMQPGPRARARKQPPRRRATPKPRGAEANPPQPQRQLPFGS